MLKIFLVTRSLKFCWGDTLTLLRAREWKHADEVKDLVTRRYDVMLGVCAADPPHTVFGYPVVRTQTPFPISTRHTRLKQGDLNETWKGTCC